MKEKNISATHLNSAITGKPKEPTVVQPDIRQADPKQRRFQQIILVVAIIMIVINTVLFITMRMYQTSSRETAVLPTPYETPTMTPTLTPTPYPLPQGKQSFQLTYGKSVTGPKVGIITIDPYDPKMNETQTITATVTDTTPVTSLAVSLTTDNKTATYSMALVSGTETSGTWGTTIQTDDTHNYSYYVHFTAAGTTGTFSGGLTLRAY